ncbi:MAG: ugtP 1 [Chlamydiales bacterium]|jgi:UDP-N-acetylglucosamine:LPS N-acetylglucosamine transferase|nr:ugtP 1 [Chlamydiales bacterium]
MEIYKILSFKNKYWFQDPQFFLQNEIECQNGFVFRKYNKDPTHYALETHCIKQIKDPIKAKRIIHSYKTYLHRYIEHEPKYIHLIANWLVNYSGFLGILPVQEQLIANTSYYLRHLIQSPILKRQFEIFVEKVCQNELSISRRLKELHPPTYRKHRKVAILSGQTGGGHQSVSNALAVSLERHGMEVELIDVDEIAKSCDPLYVMTQVHSIPDIYNISYQQEANIEKAELLAQLIEVLREYMPNSTMQLLKQHLGQSQPDFIISTCYHCLEHVYLPFDVGIPTAIFNSEYALHPKLAKLINTIQHPYFHIFSPVLDIKAESKVVNKNQVNLSELGYPVAKEFRKSITEKEKMIIQAKLGLIPHIPTVVMAMGKYGLGDRLLNNVKDLIQSQITPKKPMNIVVLCGKNLLLKQSIEDYLQVYRHQAQHFKFVIYDFLESSTVADLLLIADVLVGKPGASTIAEALATNTYFLTCDASPWEIPNEEYLINNRAGERLDLHQPLIIQIQKILSQPYKKSLHKSKDWEHLLLEKMRQLNI